MDLFNAISKIQAFESSKASSGNIPTAIKLDAKEVICPYRTNCMNVVINNWYFPHKLKEADVTAFHTNGDKWRTGAQMRGVWGSVTPPQ